MDLLFVILFLKSNLIWTIASLNVSYDYNYVACYENNVVSESSNLLNMEDGPTLSFLEVCEIFVSLRIENIINFKSKQYLGVDRIKKKNPSKQTKNLERDVPTQTTTPQMDLKQ